MGVLFYFKRLCFVNCFFISSFIYAQDFDNDGLSDDLENDVYGTDMNNPDSDNDGLTDGMEVFDLFTSPLFADTDGDQVNDGYEYYTSLTDPLMFDSDTDGLSDGEEILTYTTNPLDSDTDNDGISDGPEIYIYGSDPLDIDTDDDGLSDHLEVTIASSPISTDSDNDGLSDNMEYFTYNTSPSDFDTDSDGLEDNQEILVYNTDPNDVDTDNDGLYDGPEVYMYGSNPTDQDTDDDGLMDDFEVSLGSSPIFVDSDEDGLSDYDEYHTYSTSPLTWDSDYDGVGDPLEINVYFSDPNDDDYPDYDQDGYISSAFPTGDDCDDNDWNVFQAPEILSTVPASRCGSGSVQLEANANGAAVNWYQNQEDVVPIGNGSPWSTHIISETTTFYVEAVDGNCVSVLRTPVVATISPNLPASVSISSSDNDNKICLGQNVIFTATPINPGTSPTYKWFVNSVEVVGVVGPTFLTSSLLNNDAVSVEMTSNATPCLIDSPSTSNSITTIVIDPNSYSLNLGGVRSRVDATCNESNGSLTYNLTEGIEPYTWTWSNGVNTTNSAFDLPVGMYVVQVQDGCGKTSQDITFIRTNGTNFTFENQATDETCIDANNGNATAVITSGASEPISYLWYDISGTQIGNQAYISGLAPGMYAVVAVDANGCSNNTAIQINEELFDAQTAITNTTSDSQCDAGILEIEAIASLGDVHWYLNPTGGSSIGTGETYTTPIISSTTIYYAEAINGSCVSASRTPVTAAIYNCTKLLPQACGAILVEMNEILYYSPVANATNYEYRVEGPNGYSQTKLRGNNKVTMDMSWFPNLLMEATYTVKIRALVDGVWQDYGDACNITTPKTKLRQGSCGALLTEWNKILYYSPVYNATDFEYLVEGPNGYSQTRTRGSNKITMDMSWFTGMLTNATYTVKIRAKVGGIWGDYGDACTVTTPETTNLRSGSCGAELLVLNKPLYYAGVFGATNYEYLVEGPNGYSQTHIRGNNKLTMDMTWLHNIQALTPSTIYTVKIRALVGGNWQDYGSACDITTPASMGLIVQNSGAELDKFETIALTAYPNPSNGDFKISSSHEGTFNIINELGQLVQTVEITKENNYQVQVGVNSGHALNQQLQPGIYFITGTINNEVITNKIIVQ